MMAPNGFLSARRVFTCAHTANRQLETRSAAHGSIHATSRKGTRMPSGVGLSAVAWLVALSLALGAVGVTVGVTFHRRACETERKLRALESAVAEFCGALRAWVLAQRNKLAEGELAVRGLPSEPAGP